MSLNPIINAVQDAASLLLLLANSLTLQSTRWAQRHPQRIAGVLAALLLGTGATAFAVSTWAPDASDLPVRQVLEAVQPMLPAGSDGAATGPGSQAQGQSTALRAAVAADFTLYRTDTTRSSDSADSLLRRLGISDPQAAAFLRSDARARQALLGRAGRLVSAEADSANRLIKISARWAADNEANFSRLVVEKSAAGWASRLDTAPLTASARLASGSIRSSLFAATDDARIPDSVATQLAEIFSGDIDFHRALRKGDRFSVVYETLEADGEPIRAGHVQSAEFVNNGKTFQAVWFNDAAAVTGAAAMGGAATGAVNAVALAKGAYYTLDGNSLRKAFLTSPLEFSRMTSGYGMRMHPIARDWRAHKGVDYAAPIGTQIRAVGDGIVEFAGGQRGYGNVVEVVHSGGKSTLYAHMNSIAVRKGQRIAQGETLGAVGRTGWATGPHLHFEFRINGEHHDPLTLARQSEAVPVSTVARPAFNRMVAGMRPQLAAAASVVQASAQ